MTIWILCNNILETIRDIIILLCGTYRLSPSPISRHKILVAPLAVLFHSFGCIVNLSVEFWIAYHIVKHHLWVAKPHFVPPSLPDEGFSILCYCLRSTVCNQERIPWNVSNCHTINLPIDFRVFDSWGRRIWIKGAQDMEEFVDFVGAQLSSQVDPFRKFKISPTCKRKIICRVLRWLWLETSSRFKIVPINITGRA